MHSYSKPNNFIIKVLAEEHRSSDLTYIFKVAEFGLRRDQLSDRHTKGKGTKFFFFSSVPLCLFVCLCACAIVAYAIYSGSHLDELLR